MNRFGGAMKIASASLAAAIVCVALPITTATAADTPPRWAYIENNRNYKPPVDDGNLVRVPDSTAGYTWTQLRDPIHRADLAPGRPCAIAGYRSQWPQARCVRVRVLSSRGRPRWSGKRRPCRPSEKLHHPANGRLQERRPQHRRPWPLATEPDDRSFQADHRCRGASGGGLFLRPEAAQAHHGGRKRHRAEKLHRGVLWAAAEGSEREPLGERIVEIPDELQRFESRDPRSTFTAYVPVGSLAKGEALVTKGGPGRTVACAPCHGPDLKGLGPLPSIAGRSPSYMFRQLYDFKHGARAGEWSPLMAQVVSNLDQEDMLAIVAYLASLHP